MVPTGNCRLDVIDQLAAVLCCSKERLSHGCDDGICVPSPVLGQRAEIGVSTLGEGENVRHKAGDPSVVMRHKCRSVAGDAAAANPNLFIAPMACAFRSSVPQQCIVHRTSR